MLDREVRERFKEFQEKTGKYEDLDIDEVRFEKIQLSDSKYFEINPKKSEIDEAILADNIDVSFVPLANINPDNGEIEKFEIRKILDVKNGYTYFKENDVIFTKVTPSMENGNFAIAKNLMNGIGFGSSEYHIFRCKNVHNKLLWFLFRADFFRNRAKKTMKGSGGLKRVPLEFFDTQYIPIPKDLNEKYTSFLIQEAIVEFLEAWKIGYTDIYRERVNKKKFIYEDIKKIVVQNTFKGDTFLVEKFSKFSKSREYDLMLTDIKFEKKYLKTLVSMPVKGGGTPDTKIKDYWDDDFSLVDNVNYFGWRNIKKELFNKKTISKYSKVISKNGFNSSSTWLVPSHSLLIAIASASKGLIVMNDKPMCTNQNILGVVINKDNHTEYIYHFLKNAYRYLDSKKEFGNLTKGSEENREILIPHGINDYSSKEIQSLLVEFWEMIIGQIDKQLAIYKRMLELTNIIDQAFLYRTFSKIDWSME